MIRRKVGAISIIVFVRLFDLFAVLTVQKKRLGQSRGKFITGQSGSACVLHKFITLSRQWLRPSQKIIRTPIIVCLYVQQTNICTAACG